MDFFVIFNIPFYNYQNGSYKSRQHFIIVKMDFEVVKTVEFDELSSFKIPICNFR
jgi:hypothetical protein